MVYQSLYRRYRPGTFGEIAGQEHVVAAVRNAVREGRTGHAYLFSGPRGTGKTSTARILAKALNCTDLSDEGEPCNECESCQSFIAGNSYDLHELDAASNNGVDAVRDLIAKVALGSPGRTKVYILDEVHMLTSGAENALLKTLEEPPEHVKFVLATTEPHKVVSTIRSRTQHLRFELLAADTLTAHVRWVADDAGLDVDDSVIAHVVREGAGSVRDTLSALDQVVAAGGVHGDTEGVERIVEALASVDSAAAMVAVEDALRAGRDPRVIGELVLGRLRDGFLAAINADLSHLPETDTARAVAVAEIAGAARLTRAMESLGTALIDMRQAPDPRIDLEVALLRLTRPELDTSPAALVERIERLERGAPVPSAAASVATVRESSRPESAELSAATPPEPEPGSTDSPVPPAPDTAANSPAEAAPEPTESAPAPPAKGARPADLARQTLAASKGARGARGGSNAKPSLGALRGSATTASPKPESPPAESAKLPANEPEAVEGAVAAPDSDGSASEASPDSDPPDAAATPASDDSATKVGPDPEITNAAESPDPEPALVLSSAETPQPGAPSASDAVDVEGIWESVILPAVSKRARARFQGGHFVSSTPDGATFSLPNEIHRDRCHDVLPEIQAELERQYGDPVRFELVVGDTPNPANETPTTDTADVGEEELDSAEVADLDDADIGTDSGIDRLTQMFPGAEVVQPEQP